MGVGAFGMIMEAASGFTEVVQPVKTNSGRSPAKRMEGFIRADVTQRRSPCPTHNRPAAYRLRRASFFVGFRRDESWAAGKGFGQPDELRHFADLFRKRF